MCFEKTDLSWYAHLCALFLSFRIQPLDTNCRCLIAGIIEAVCLLLTLFCWEGLYLSWNLTSKSLCEEELKRRGFGCNLNLIA